MEFCPECDSLLIIERGNKGKTLLKCRECDYSSKLGSSKMKEYILSDEIIHTELDKTEIIDAQEVSSLPEEIREDLTESFREALETFEY